MRKLASSLALVGVALTGCSDDGASSTGGDPAPILEPPKAGEGVQFVMNTHIDKGVETEHCKFVKAPPEGLLVNRDEVKFTEGSHHFLLYLTPYEDIPTQNERGETIDTSDVFDCSEGATNGWRVTNLVGGSQNATGESIVDFPPDVAMTVPGNAVLLMNAHYINASDQPIDPEVRINLYTIPASQKKYEGGLLFWFDIFIKMLGKSQATAEMRCELPDDVTITNAQSHMHRRGVGYAAELIDPAGAETTIYENDAWEGVAVKKFDDGLSVTGGSSIRFHCDYQNPNDATIYQGPRSTDEMCMFIASYYPATPKTSLCSSDASDPTGTNYLGAEWSGQGDKTCAATLQCVAAIDQGADFYGFLHALTDCVVDSDPAKRKEVSDGVRCLLTHADPQAECGPEIQACLAN
jgi:hypothetical protein